MFREWPRNEWRPSINDLFPEQSSDNWLDINVLLSSGCSTVEFSSSCPCYTKQFVGINRSQLVWPQTSDVAWVGANVFGILKHWISLKYYITLTQFCLVVRSRELNVKETQRFTVRNYTVLLYLVPTSQGSKCESKSKPNANVRKANKTDSSTFI